MKLSIMYLFALQLSAQSLPLGGIPASGGGGGGISFVSGTNEALACASSGCTVTTPAVDTTTVDLIIIALSCFNSACPAASAVTDSVSGTNNGAPAALTPQTSGGYGNARLYYWAHPSHVGAGHTFSATCNYCTIMVKSFKGTSVSTFDVQSGAVTSVSASTSMQPGSLTPSGDHELIVTAVANYQGTLFTPPAGYTALAFNPGGVPSDYTDNTNSACGAFTYQIQTTAAAANPTWTLDGSLGSLSAAVMAVFK